MYCYQSVAIPKNCCHLQQKLFSRQQETMPRQGEQRLSIALKLYTEPSRQQIKLCMRKSLDLQHKWWEKHESWNKRPKHDPSHIVGIHPGLPKTFKDTRSAAYLDLHSNEHRAELLVQLPQHGQLLQAETAEPVRQRERDTFRHHHPRAPAAWY